MTSQWKNEMEKELHFNKTVFIPEGQFLCIQGEGNRADQGSVNVQVKLPPIQDLPLGCNVISEECLFSWG